MMSLVRKITRTSKKLQEAEIYPCNYLCYIAEDFEQKSTIYFYNKIYLISVLQGIPFCAIS